MRRKHGAYKEKHRLIYCLWSWDKPSEYFPTLEDAVNHSRSESDRFFECWQEESRYTVEMVRKSKEVFPAMRRK